MRTGLYFVSFGWSSLVKLRFRTDCSLLMLLRIPQHLLRASPSLYSIWWNSFLLWMELMLALRRILALHLRRSLLWRSMRQNQALWFFIDSWDIWRLQRRFILWDLLCVTRESRSMFYIVFGYRLPWLTLNSLLLVIKELSQILVWIFSLYLKHWDNLIWWANLFGVVLL